MTKVNVFILSLSTALLAQPASAQWSVGGYVGQSNARSLVDCRNGQFPITTLTTSTIDQGALFGDLLFSGTDNFAESDFLSEVAGGGLLTERDLFVDGFVTFDSGLAFDLITNPLDPSLIVFEETSFFGSAEDIFGQSDFFEIDNVDGEDVLLSVGVPPVSPVVAFENVDFGNVGEFDSTDLGDFLGAVVGPIDAVSDVFVGTITESFGTFECQTDSTDVGYGLNVAYNFNKTWGVEFGYVDLGEFTSEFSAPGIDPNFSPLISQRSKVEASAFYLAATGSYYYNKKWSVTARAGIYRLEQDISFEGSSVSTAFSTGFGGTTISQSIEEGSGAFSFSDEDFYYGISWNYDFSDPVQFQLRYDHFDADVFSFGVQYRFGK